MTKLDAILALLDEQEAFSRSVAQANKIKQAADVLGLNHVERFQLYENFEYHDGERWLQPREAESAGGFTKEVMVEVREALGYVMSKETH